MQAIDQNRGSSLNRASVSADDRFEAGRSAGPSRTKMALGALLLASIAWVVAAPSAPALIFVIGCLVACVGWGD